MIDFKIEIKEKHKSQQRTKLSENLPLTYTLKFFQSMLLNSKFLHFKWSFLERQYSLSFIPNIWQLNETCYLNFL